MDHDANGEVEASAGAVAATLAALVVLVAVIVLFLLFKFNLFNGGRPATIHSSLRLPPSSVRIVSCSMCSRV